MVTVFPLDPSNSMNWSGGSDIPDTVPIIETTPDYQSEGELRKYRTKRMRAAGKIQIPNAGQSAVYKDAKMSEFILKSSGHTNTASEFQHSAHPSSTHSNSASTVIEVGDAVRRSSWKRSKETEKKEWIVRASNLLNEHYAQSRAGYIVSGNATRAVVSKLESRRDEPSSGVTKILSDAISASHKDLDKMKEESLGEHWEWLGRELQVYHEFMEQMKKSFIWSEP
ncbi:hypothetical protein CRE_07608 [Caenorhabditis remanei]|uniref:Uncharacterized protein n=1 Tax=Caenorhabditis remanei TaxID=31234 RepID=E3MP80_CAERE|nr:hypothetical protein CRE_07608 [Caenorhabditis remanei]